MSKTIELTRHHLIAVRLMDAVNLEMSRRHDSFQPSWAGFRLTIKIGPCGGLVDRPWLYIEPAGWPKGSLVKCYLEPKDGWQWIDGTMRTPHLGNFAFAGYDYGGGMDRKPSGTMISLVWSEQS